MSQQALTELNPRGLEASRKLINIMLIIGFTLILFGIITVVLAALLSQTSSTSSGIIIFIGPIPIISGSGPEASLLIFLAAGLTILGLVTLLLLRRKTLET
jgi:LPXTG-motif cell wall-anchored protein